MELASREEQGGLKDGKGGEKRCRAGRQHLLNSEARVLASALFIV